VRRLCVRVLTKTTALGGAERLVMNTLPYLDRDAFDYGLGAFDDDGPLGDACRETGLPFRTLPGRTFAPAALPALRRWLLAERVDVLHAHLPLPGALARLAARGTGTRVVYTEHTTQDVYHPLTRWLNAASYAWQDAVVAVSDPVRASAVQSIGGRAERRIAVVPNGVDLSALDRQAARAPRPWPPCRRGALRVLVPASLQVVKGHDVLVAALSRLRDGRPLDVWLAGEGPERSRIARAAARAGLGGAVRLHLLGRRPDVFALMRAADMVVLPSRREGLPLALLEARALGRAVIASAVGGVPDVVRPEEDGLLVPAADPIALARALSRLAASPALRERLGAAAARCARERFDVRHTVASLEALYRRVSATAEPAPPSRPLPVGPPRRAAAQADNVRVT